MQAHESDGPAMRRALAIAFIICGGLVLDQAIDFWGQTLVNIAVWSVLLGWLRAAPPTERPALWACLFYATLGELFLSLVWGLYEYRLGNVPLFVPPGHVLLFMLGRTLAACMPGWVVWLVPLAAAPAVLTLALAGISTLDAVLFALFLACLASGRAARLYAVMFVLALAMELYGTWLGNWTWAPASPHFPFTALNPPLAAGTFYCLLDLLVVATVARRPQPGRAPVPALLHAGGR